jgi:hypothetical protein
MNKSWVVVLHNGKGSNKRGTYSIWADYGYIWGSAVYEVLEYFACHKEAKTFIKEHSGIN